MCRDSVRQASRRNILPSERDRFSRRRFVRRYGDDPVNSLWKRSEEQRERCRPRCRTAIGRARAPHRFVIRPPLVTSVGASISLWSRRAQHALRSFPHRQQRADASNVSKPIITFTHAVNRDKVARATDDQSAPIVSRARRDVECTCRRSTRAFERYGEFRGYRSISWRRSNVLPFEKTIVSGLAMTWRGEKRGRGRRMGKSFGPFEICTRLSL